VNTRAVHFPLMDSIRAIALLSMMAAHTSFFIALNGSHALQHVRFDFAVRVFFVISAFLLYRPFVRSRLRDDWVPSTKAYAWRRLLRIVPCYWVALTAITIWLGLHGVFTASGIPTFYGLAQIYRESTILGGLPQAWSISVELAFYVMLPLYAMLMRRVRARDSRARLGQELAGAAVLFLISVAFKAVLGATGAIEDEHAVFLQSNPLVFLDDFALGMALAAVSAFYEKRSDLPGALRVVDRWPALPWAIAVGALVVVSTQLGLSGQLGEPVHPSQYIERHYLFMVVALGLVLPAMFGDPARGLVRRILANRVLLYLGAISYAVYLYHFAVLIQLENWDFRSLAHGSASWLWYPAALAAGVAIATVSLHVVERPFLKLKRLVPPFPQAREARPAVEQAPANFGPLAKDPR
jgi:peptidoglycan/LPS O-acetylase OafA/YrhL